MQVAERGSAGVDGIKHTQLTKGAPVKGAGELVVDGKGSITINNQSGRYTRQSPEAIIQFKKYLENFGLDVKLTNKEL